MNKLHGEVSLQQYQGTSVQDEAHQQTRLGSITTTTAFMSDMFNIPLCPTYHSSLMAVQSSPM